MNVPNVVIRDIVRRERIYRDPARPDAREKRLRAEREEMPVYALCVEPGCGVKVAPRFRYTDPFHCSYHRSGAA